MKKYKLIVFLAALVFGFSACETDVVDPTGLRGEGIIPSITNVNPAFFDVNDAQNAFIKFDVDVAGAVSEVIVEVSYNGDMRRVTLTNFSTFPATDIIIYMRDVASALSIPIDDVKPGDVFAVELVTVQGEKRYRSSALISAAAACAYDPALVTGSYNAFSPDWPADGNVTVTVDPDDEYTIYVEGLAALDGLDEDQGPLKMHVDPLNFEVTAERTVLATAAFGYDNIAYEGFGTLNTCDGTYNMNFTITVDQGSFGQYVFTLTKN